MLFGCQLNDKSLKGGAIMKIKRTFWHCKISNLGNDWERVDDNLCCYFWGFVGKLTLIFVAVVLVCFFIYAYFTSDLLISNTILLLFLCLSIALPSFVIHLIRKSLGKFPEMPYENIVVEYILAKKRKVCPLIKYI